MRSAPLLAAAAALVIGAGGAGCAGKKTAERVTRDGLHGKKVALTDVKGGPESKVHVEVAIVNEIMDEGRFQIIDRTTVQEALATYPTEGDWQRLGQKVGADYVLSINIAEFNITERQGHDKVEEEDSVLTEESGERKPVVGKRYVKVKSYDGSVKLSCVFFDVGANAITYQGYGFAQGAHNSRDPNMPGKMQLLENLSAKAIHDFFEKIPQ